MALDDFTDYAIDEPQLFEVKDGGEIEFGSLSLEIQREIAIVEILRSI